MFTGIVEEIGTVASLKKFGGGLRLSIEATESSRSLGVNDSIAVNGVCQTVVDRKGKRFDVVAVEETLKKTNLGRLKKGNRVNLELPMRLNERLGGHLVLGHVDGVGRIHAIDKRETSWLFSLKIPEKFLKYIVPVGSIGIDGVSLTVAEVEDDIARVSIIPQTMSHTIFGSYRVGDDVNLEFDVIGKYVERLVADRPGTALVFDENVLRELGY